MPPRKSTYWKKVAVKTSVWIVSEIVLNLVGTDSLADYGEFVFDMQRLSDTLAAPTVLSQTINPASQSIAFLVQ